MPANRFKSKGSKAQRAKNSAGWFYKQVGKASKGFRKTKLQPGKMFTFGYDAKHKKTLPYWDRFPLIIVLDVAKYGFIGINFHYLTPMQRRTFLSRLAKFENRKMNKYDITWDAVKKIEGADKMIHKYLYGHVRTTLLEAPMSEWENVINLPYQKFVGASASEVWSK
jgi:hypothetical protein